MEGGGGPSSTTSGRRCRPPAAATRSTLAQQQHAAHASYGSGHTGLPVSDSWIIMPMMPIIAARPGGMQRRGVG